MRAAAITATVIARNEANDLPRCLASIQQVTPNVVVVDDYSSDDTLQIAEAWGARTSQRALAGNFARQRNFALDQVDTGWALMLDADEVLSEELAEEILAVPDEAEIDAFTMPRKNFFKDRELRGTRFGSQVDSQVRLFRSQLRYTDSHLVHEHIGWQNGLRNEQFKNPILHYTYRSLGEYVAKMRRYSSLEAQMRGGIGNRRAATTAVVNLVRGKGYRDGMFGLVSAVGDSIYELKIQHAQQTVAA